MKRRTILAICLVIVAVTMLVLWRLADLDLDHRASETFEIGVSGNTIAGTIWLPDQEPVAVVAIVHGDGPQDRTSSGGYAPMINSMLDRGIAVASWDKPGVGASKGNWLLQSMADRTDETRAVLRHIKERFKGVTYGALGFSQAGWVLPSLTRKDADFLVLVGAAVSWKDQGDYYTRVRLARDGLNAQAIEEKIATQKIEDERAFGPDADLDDIPANMSKDRWRFLRRNQHADAMNALSVLDLPLLAIWGADDLNVDASRNAAIYRKILTGRNVPTRIVIWPDATHGLLKARDYNWQLTKNWSSFAILRFLLEGRYAYAPGALDAIVDWIVAFEKNDSGRS